MRAATWSREALSSHFCHILVVRLLTRSVVYPNGKGAGSARQGHISAIQRGFREGPSYRCRHSHPVNMPYSVKKDKSGTSWGRLPRHLQH